MATKFRAKAGTQPNASGLEQIPAGASRIPQGFLNGIGRKIDQATVRFSGDFLFQQLPGGTILQPLDTEGVAPLGAPHPFKVTLVSKGDGKINVRISEGRIIGRTEFVVGAYANDAIGLYTSNASLGIPGVDYSYNGGWPDGNPAPDTSGGTNPTSTGTQSTESKPGSGGTYHTPVASGNAGSITNPGQGNSGIYHTQRPSGNAGSITNPSQGSSGIYHTQRPSGNAGNINTYPQIYNRGMKNGVYVNPPKQ